MFTCGWVWLACWPIRPIWASGEAKFTKMGDCMPWTLIKTDMQNLTPLALSSAEKSVTIQTNTQAVTDMSKPCLSACVNNHQSSSIWHG